MYDQFLSLGWISDRCIEIRYFLPGLFIIFSLLGWWAITRFLQEKEERKNHTTPPWAIGAVLFIVSFAIALLFILGNVVLSRELLQKVDGALQLVILLFIVGIILFTYIRLLFSLHRLRKQKLFTFLYFFLTAPIAGYMVSVLVFIITLFICDDGHFYPYGAHQLHGVMKTWHDAGKPWPKDVRELRARDQESFDHVLASSKISYVPDLAHDRYTLMVRASKYVVVVFDPIIDYRIYALPPLRPWRTDQQKWPPTYPGPWDKLPQ